MTCVTLSVKTRGDISVQPRSVEISSLHVRPGASRAEVRTIIITMTRGFGTGRIFHGAVAEYSGSPAKRVAEPADDARGIGPHST